MSFPLATLADVKAEFGYGHRENDAALSDMLLAATALLERLAGRRIGAFRRYESIVEYPRGGSPRTGAASRYLRLDRTPIESVASVIQRTSPAPAAYDLVGVDLTAETELTQNVDFVVDDAEYGRLERVDASWIFGPRFVRVAYTAGWCDPSLTPGQDGLAATAILPPDDVQRAIVDQAATYWNLRGKQGFTDVRAGGPGGGGGAGFDPELLKQANPRLRTAAERLKRFSL